MKNMVGEVPEEVKAHISDADMSEFTEELGKLSTRFFYEGVEAYHKGLIEAFSMVAINDVPGKEQRYTAVEVIKLIKAMRSQFKVK